jgi:broad specificity phosphatase PhoE
MYVPPLPSPKFKPLKILIREKCYWSLQNGNETSTWSDARLTEVGKAQAQTAHNAWRTQIENQIPFPEVFYVSPLNRCLQTAYITFDGLEKEVVTPFRPVVKEVRNTHPFALELS